MPKLLDGREVPSDSEEWRHECQCRAIARLQPVDVRRDTLAQLEKRFGKPYVDSIKDTLTKLWKARQP
ncbi:MAG: hypothetical protein HEQ39_09930 [Rhizobacter sp.]